jgi:aminopeptidase N
MRSTLSRLAPVAPLALVLLAGSALAQPHPHVHADHPTHHECGADACGKARIMRTLFERGLNPDGSPWGSAGEGSGHGSGDPFADREAFTATDLLHNNLDIEIIPATTTITGSNTMTIRSLVNNLTEFTFMLRSNFTVSQVQFNGATNLAPPTSVGSYGRRVTLPRAVAQGETFTLRIAYTGQAVSRGFGSIEFTTLGGQDAVFTLSEPYFAATWWPAKDGDFGQPGDNADKATFDIAITAPSAMTVATNGLLQGIDTLSGNRRKHRWATNYPMATYLAAFGAATYTTYNGTYNYPLPGGGTGTMPLNFFVSPSSDTQALRNVWLRSIDMMAAFRPIFGEYPFVNEKYGIYQFTFGGGMEHQTMTGQSASTSESLTAHELGHQWFGDNITCRTWSDIWLNEGFATYSECVWQERRNGAPDRAALLAAINARRPATLDSGSVYRYDTSSVNSIFSSTYVYNKGAWVVHTLRKTLGEALFSQVLADYRAQFEGSAATTDDFAAVVSTVAGRDMAPFFDAWVYGEATPIFASGSQRVTINGRDYLKLRVRQTQAAPASDFFPAGLDVRVVAAGGTQDAFVLPGARTSWHLIPLSVSGAVSSVTLDREDWILNRGKTTETYVQGPPKVVSLSPAAGATIPSGSGPASIQIGFSDAITAAAANFTLTRDGTPVPFTYAFNPSTLVATLTPSAPLAGGVYAVTALDTLTANGGQRLDGELAGGLPSGDGAPLGTASFSFTIEATACPADFNNDGFLDFFDYDAFVNAYEAGDPASDINQDGFLDFFDYDDFVALYEAGC